MLHGQGFAILRQYGDWNYEPLTESSPSIIVVCRQAHVTRRRLNKRRHGYAAGASPCSGIAGVLTAGGMARRQCPDWLLVGLQPGAIRASVPDSTSGAPPGRYAQERQRCAQQIHRRGEGGAAKPLARQAALRQRAGRRPATPEQSCSSSALSLFGASVGLTMLHPGSSAGRGENKQFDQPCTHAEQEPMHDHCSTHPHT